MTTDKTAEADIRFLTDQHALMAKAGAGTMMVTVEDLGSTLSELARLQAEVKGLREVCQDIVANAEDPAGKHGTDTIRLLTELQNIALKARATLQGQQS